MKSSEKSMEKIVNLCKARGFIFAGSEIYGGLANTWDYGPLGVELKNNVKKAWWKKFVQENPYNVGLDAAILMNPQVWVASGHVGGFSDPLMDCKECHERFRADKVIEDWCQENGFQLGRSVDAMSQQEMKSFIDEHQIACPTCGKFNWTDIRQFNLMFKTFQGVTEDAKNTVYLRPETAQGIFTNFVNVQRTTRRKLPFGIGQIGKSFRNEITPGNFIFRTREFEQMELEFFCKPGTELEWFAYWKDFCHQWLLNLGVKEENLRLHPALAPFKCAVLPLSKKLGGKAREIQAELSKHFMVDFDDAGSIGKRYRRQDETGTPYCITVDFATVGSETETADHAVTIRDRDTMDQVRVPISELKSWLEEKLAY